MSEGFDVRTAGFTETVDMLDKLSERGGRLATTGALRVAAREGAKLMRPDAPIRVVPAGESALVSARTREKGKTLDRLPGNLRRQLGAYRLKRDTDGRFRWRIGVKRRAFYHVILTVGSKRGARRPWMGRSWATHRRAVAAKFDAQLAKNTARWLKRETNGRNPKRDRQQ